MRRVLLTGMSGTGKSTVIQELAARGYNAVDVDAPAWSMHAPDGEWIWREDRVRSLLAGDADGLLFVSGCASNQGQFYPRFDEVILLSAPAAVMAERLATRTTNDFGKQPEELAKIMRDLAETEPRLRRTAGHEIDASAPLDDVIAQILAIALPEP